MFSYGQEIDLTSMIRRQVHGCFGGVVNKSNFS